MNLRYKNINSVRWRRVLLPGFFLLCTFFTTFSQQEDVNLDSLDWEIDLDQFLVTGTYSPTHYKRALHQVDVLKASEIESRGVNTLDEALELIPSVNLVVDPAIGTQVKMRGLSSNNVAILVDGVPVVGRIDGGIDLSQIALQNIQRIEVVQGPLSNIYGNNAAGGAINIITKKHQENKIHFSSDHQYESIGVHSHQAFLGAKWNKWSANISGRFYDFNAESIDSLRVFDKIERDNQPVFFQRRYPWNPKTQVSIGGAVMYSWDADNFIRFKYDRNGEELTEFGIERRPRFNPYSQDKFYNTKRNDLSLNYDGKLGKDLQVNALVAKNRFTRDIEDKRYYIELDSFDSELTQEDNTKLDVVLSRLVFSKPISKKINTTVGLSHTSEKGKGTRIFNRNSADSSSIRLNEIAAFLQIDYDLTDKMKVGFSGRHTVHNKFENKFTPNIQLKYDVTDKLTLRTSYAQGYRIPSLKEQYLDFVDVNHNVVGNMDLTPETSHDVQLQASYQTKNKTTFSLSLYNTTVKDRIELFEYRPLNFQYQNIDDYHVYGGQAGINWSYKNFTFDHGVSLGYFSTSLPSSDSKEYNHTWDSKHSISYNLKKWKSSIRVDYRFTGKKPSFVLENEQLSLREIESNHMLNIATTTRLLEDKMSLSLGVKNVLDVTNVIVLGGTLGTRHDNSDSRLIDQGRSVFLRLGIRL